MKTVLVGCCVALLYPLAGSASNDDTSTFFPQQMSAKGLMTLCASSSLTAKGRTRRRYCDGFVSGVEEGMRLYQLKYRIESTAAVCVPEGTSSRKMAEAFVQYASAKGVDLQKPAASIVLDALRSKFTC